MNTPEISVIVTSYNRARFLEETIRSVLNQTYQNFEIVIVDDGSTDNTMEIVCRLISPRVRYIYQENRGAGAARNTGLQYARGQYIALLDADDIWLPEKLEKQLQALEMNPQASVVYTNLLFFGAKQPSSPDTFFELLQWPPPRGKVIDQMVIRSFGHPSTLLVKKEVFDKIGLFDEGLPYCDDYDMLIRMAANFEFEVIAAPLVKYRLHPSQISNNLERVITNHLIVFDKNRRLLALSSHNRRRLNRRSAEYHFYYACQLAKHHQLSRSLREIFSVIQCDIWRLFPLTLSMTQRLLNR